MNQYVHGKSMVRFFIALAVIFLSFRCAPVSRTNSGSKAQSDDGEKISPVPVANGEAQLTLPSWCSMMQSTDQVCFKCEREDAGVKLPYEQCLVPADSFKATTDCAFTSADTKSITCAGTRSGETFVMDVSLAKEKLIAAVPVFMIALQLTIQQKYRDREDLASLTTDLTSFITSRVAQIIRGEDLETVASDLLLLVNRYAKTKLTEEQSSAFKKFAMEALDVALRELHGRKDYKLSRFILRGLALGKQLPSSAIGDAGHLLTGPGLAALLAENDAKSIEGTFKILNPSVLGARSVDDLLLELKNGL